MKFGLGSSRNQGTYFGPTIRGSFIYKDPQIGALIQTPHSKGVTLVGTSSEAAMRAQAKQILVTGGVMRSSPPRTSVHVGLVLIIGLSLLL